MTPAGVRAARGTTSGTPPHTTTEDGIALLRRRPELPASHAAAWQAFLDCAGVVEGGIRTLLGTLPLGRVEPVPVGLGIAALRTAIADAREWMPQWHVPELTEDWQDCERALELALGRLAEVEEVAASTDELEELQESVHEVVGGLDAFADAERTWRRTWRLPRGRPV